MVNGASAIGLAAVANSENANRLGLLVETDPIVSNAGAILGRVDALEPTDVARTGTDQALDRLPDPPGDSFVKGRHVS